MDAIGIAESIAPIDRLTVRLAEWASLGSKDLVEPQAVPYEVWVGGSRVQEPAQAESADAGGTDNDDAKRLATPGGSYIQFVVDHESHEVTVKVIDRASGEVVRTIPPEELAKYAHESEMNPGAILEALL